MSKFFTVISALLLLVIAAAHGLRAYEKIAIKIGDNPYFGAYDVPPMASWVCAGVLAVLAIMVFVELIRGK